MLLSHDGTPNDPSAERYRFPVRTVDGPLALETRGATQNFTNAALEAVDAEIDELRPRVAEGDGTSPSALFFNKTFERKSAAYYR